MSKKGGGVKADVSWLAAYLSRNPQANNAETEKLLRGDAPKSPMAQAIEDIGLGRHQRSAKAKEKASTGLATKKSYISTLLDSVEGAVPHAHVECFPDGTLRELAVWFVGARVLTVNQMISVFHNRQFQYFKYKNRWRAQMKSAIDALRLDTGIQGGFIHPVKIEVMRHATRPVDRDALPTMFKILIDALRHEETGVIRDDNPDEVVDILPYQKRIYLSKGQVPGVGMRVIAQPDWVAPPIPDVMGDWLKKPPSSC